MLTHLKQILRISHHKIYIHFDNTIYYGMTKTKLKRLINSQKWMDGVAEIDTDYKTNKTFIYWKGIYNDTKGESNV